jgi:hypothetical protein
MAFGRIEHAGEQAVAVMAAVIPEYEACLRFLEKLKVSRSGLLLQAQRIERIERLLDDYTAMLFRPYGKLERIVQLSRYVRGCFHRMRMAAEKPLQYDECVRTLDNFRSYAQGIRALHESHLPEVARCLDEFEEMIEEFALALFAHGQIAPRFPVSEQRLRRKMEAVKEAVRECR